MCTCIHTPGSVPLFGRNLDLQSAYGETLVLYPRNAPLPLRHGTALSQHYAMLGAARVEHDFPLFFDAVNEHGLAIAGLNFPQFCIYPAVKETGDCLASFELTPCILGTCRTTAEAKARLAHITITDTPFSPALPPTPLHFMIADGKDCIVVESTSDGLHVYDNPVHVMTNSPAFPYHLQHLQEYLNVTAAPAVNRFSDALALHAAGCGMGGKGLPGDLSSSSRFVRAAFAASNRPIDNEPQTAIAHFFHMLAFVAFPRGCVLLENGQDEHTVYSCCMDLMEKTYYYTTYENSALTAVRMDFARLNDDRLTVYGMPRSIQITRLR